jgi:hypothetical protein
MSVLLPAAVIDAQWLQDALSKLVKEAGRWLLPATKSMTRGAGPMHINQPTTVVGVRSTSGRRRWFVPRRRTKRTAPPVWTSEAEVLRAMGECRPSPRGSPSRPPELPLARPWF